VLARLGTPVREPVAWNAGRPADAGVWARLGAEPVAPVRAEGARDAAPAAAEQVVERAAGVTGAAGPADSR